MDTTKTTETATCRKLANLTLIMMTMTQWWTTLVWEEYRSGTVSSHALGRRVQARKEVERKRAVVQVLNLTIRVKNGGLDQKMAPDRRIQDRDQPIITGNDIQRTERNPSNRKEKYSIRETSRWANPSTAGTHDSRTEDAPAHTVTMMTTAITIKTSPTTNTANTTLGETTAWTAACRTSLTILFKGRET